MNPVNAPLTALITGASRGIGRAIAIALAKRGVRIAVHFQKDRSAAETTLRELAGEHYVIVQADLSQASAAEQLWNEATASLGPIRVLINNAGTYRDHPPLTTSYAAWQEEWKRTLATNLLGPAHLSLLATQSMAAESVLPHPMFGRGRMVNISSRGAFRGEPAAPAYGASKAGLNSLSQSLAVALAPRQVYVFCLAPGWVDTEMASDYLAGPRGAEILAQHPLGRVTSPEEIAHAAVFCALDAPAAMTGSIIDVNGASYLRT